MYISFVQVEPSKDDPLFDTIMFPFVFGFSFTGMIASIGFANLSFVKVDTSRNLFILGFGLFIGLGVPDYLAKNPGAIQTGNHHYMGKC